MNWSLAPSIHMSWTHKIHLPLCRYPRVSGNYNTGLQIQDAMIYVVSECGSLEMVPFDPETCELKRAAYLPYTHPEYNSNRRPDNHNAHAHYKSEREEWEPHSVTNPYQLWKHTRRVLPIIKPCSTNNTHQEWGIFPSPLPPRTLSPVHCSPWLTLVFWSFALSSEIYFLFYYPLLILLKKCSLVIIEQLSFFPQILNSTGLLYVWIILAPFNLNHGLFFSPI